MADCHMCRWVSTMPGMMMPPDASISWVPSGTERPTPTSAILPSTTRTSPFGRTVCWSSIVSTIPLRNTMG